MNKAGLEFQKVEAGHWHGSHWRKRWWKPDIYAVERCRGTLGNYPGTRIRKEGGYWYWTALLNEERIGYHFTTMNEAADAIQLALETVERERKERDGTE